VPPTLRRALPRVAVDASLTDAVSVLRQGDSHLAAVVGPSGAETSVLFLEDALEELIGQVDDVAHADSG
jgi:CBS domain containing-hemolysin-like protein